VQASGISPKSSLFLDIQAIGFGNRTGIAQESWVKGYAEKTQRVQEWVGGQWNRAKDPANNFGKSLGASAPSFEAKAIGAQSWLPVMAHMASEDPAAMKHGIQFDGPDKGYSFRPEATPPIDQRQVGLLQKAFTGLGHTMGELTKLTEDYSTATGKAAKQLREQIQPLEQQKDAYLKNIKNINDIEDTATKESRGNVDRKKLLMDALVSSRSVELRDAELGVESGGGRWPTGRHLQQSTWWRFLR